MSALPVAPGEPAAAMASKRIGAAPAAAPAPRTIVVGDALFLVTAPQFPGCQPLYGTVVVTARWDVSSLKVERVAIFVESPGNAKTLWAEEDPRGKSDTGPWVIDKTQFILTDKKSGRELARRMLEATPCN